MIDYDINSMYAGLHGHYLPEDIISMETNGCQLPSKRSFKNKMDYNNQLSETDTRNYADNGKVKFQKLKSLLLKKHTFKIQLSERLVGYQPQPVQQIRILSVCGKYTLGSEYDNVIFDINDLNNLLSSRGHWILSKSLKKTDYLAEETFAKLSLDDIKSEFAEYFI